LTRARGVFKINHVTLVRTSLGGNHMPFLSGTRLRQALVFGVAVLAFPWAQAPAVAQVKKADISKRVSFQTVDGVELQGTYYPATGEKKDACVLCLHNFDARKGGNSHQDGWDRLAAELQKNGYPVLTFDFRGFGDSKTVNKEVFWDGRRNPQNGPNFIRAPRGAEAPGTIDQKDFRPAYYPTLVNDVMAAKAYLDQKNDSNELNSASVCVIGAGEGAAVGALWMAAECRLRRWKNYGVGVLGTPPNLGEPEAGDIACGLWLSISPNIGGVRAPIQTWLAEAGGTQQIPMYFIHGAKDTAADTIVQRTLPIIRRASRTKLSLTGGRAIAGTKLSGSQLLQPSLDTASYIQKYLDSVMETRGSRQTHRHDLERDTYVWVGTRGNQPQQLAKEPGEDKIKPVPVQLFFPR
jgi:pimeloyl-ACP methyl ester carboxylesterase